MFEILYTPLNRMSGLLPSTSSYRKYLIHVSIEMTGMVPPNEDPLNTCSTDINDIEGYRGDDSKARFQRRFDVIF